MFPPVVAWWAEWGPCSARPFWPLAGAVAEESPIVVERGGWTSRVGGGNHGDREGREKGHLEPKVTTMAMPPKKRTELLELVRHEPGLPVATLAERVGCGMSYAYRMIEWLEEHGDIVRTKGNSASNAGGVFPATDGAIWVEKAGTTAPATHQHPRPGEGKQVDRLVELAVGSRWSWERFDSARGAVAGDRDAAR